MKRVLALVVLAASSTAAQEVDNVAAFARLYGVARWFYPSDAAASLDWNRFAVYGVGRVRGARTPAELETALKELFTPLGPGIEIGRTLSAKPATGARDASLVAWRYNGAGMSASIRGPYSARRMNRAIVPVRDPNAFGNVSQWITADTLRGKTIRLRGQMRVDASTAKGSAGFWLRVDRAPQQMGFFDNMMDRPVRDTVFREFVIEGPIASDATRIAFGAISSGDVITDVDAIQLDVRSEGGAWTPLTIPDARFEADSAASPWIHNGGRGGQYRISRANGVVRITPVALTNPPPERPADEIDTPIAGASVDIELTPNLRARVPLSLTDADARGGSDIPVLRVLQDPWRRDDVEVRLADVVVAWNVFRHFYPYLNDLNLDWDARLKPQLEVARKASSTREAHLDAVRALVAEARDGHGSVRDVAQPLRTASLPLRFRILDGKAVVTASNVVSVPVGAVVTHFDSTPAADRIARELRLASGTVQWRRSRAAAALSMCRLGSEMTLALESHSATLPCTFVAPAPLEKRPEVVTKLEPGIWYVDLTRVVPAQITPVIYELASAPGVVFDLRGYPTGWAVTLLSKLLKEPEDTTAGHRWMHVSRIVGPFGEIADWQSMSWNLKLMSPHFTGRRVFLTDGGAISYAESVMGYVRDHKLATIIGGTTAGTNGNIADFTVPGGFTVVFTGMRVTRHDSRTPYHMLGVSPDIPLEPTIAGIRAGRDELLERALAVLKAPPTPQP